MSVTVRIAVVTRGRECLLRTVELTAPPCLGHPSLDGVSSFCDGTCRSGLDDWWEEVVFPETGDGHGIDFDGGSCYTATILQSDVPGLAGETYEWVD